MIFLKLFLSFFKIGALTFGGGMAMLPLIREGLDSVVLSPITKKLKKYDIPLYRRADGSYIIHRIVALKDGAYTMAGDNQFVYEKGITDEQMIALVTSVRRGEKIISPDSLSQRIYAIFRHRTRWLRHLIQRVIRKIKYIFAHQDLHFA